MRVLEFHSGCKIKFESAKKIYQAAGSGLADADWKDKLELWVVVKGSVCTRDSKGEMKTAAGGYLLFPTGPGTESPDFFVPTGGCTFYRLRFACGEVSARDGPFDKPSTGNGCGMAIPASGKVPMPETIVILIEQLQDAVRFRYSEQALDSMLGTILQFLYNQICSGGYAAGPGASDRRRVYKTVIHYVRSNISENIRVSDIAAHFGYNDKYLSNLFSAEGGIPLKQFILVNKMNAANQMLAHTQKPVGEIALALGFTDSHNFAKAYKKICGVTPSDYRNRMLLEV